MDFNNANYLDLPIQDSEIAEDCKASVDKLIKRSKIDTTAFSSYIEKVQNPLPLDFTYLSDSNEIFDHPEIDDISTYVDKARSDPKSKNFMGLLPEINHYWITSNSSLRLYGIDTNTEVVYEKIPDIIVKVHLAPTVKGHFHKDMKYVLVITTSRFIHIVAVESRGNIIKLHETPYKVPVDGVIYTTITSTPEGRIFLSGIAPHITEITYSNRKRFWKKSMVKKSIVSSYPNLLIPSPIREQIPKKYLLHGDDSFKQLVYDVKTRCLFALSSNNVICAFDVPLTGGIVRATRYSRFSKDYIGSDKTNIVSISCLLPEERIDSPRRVDLCATLSTGERVYLQFARQKYKGTCALIYVATRKAYSDSLHLVSEITHPSFAGTNIMTSFHVDNTGKKCKDIHLFTFSLSSYDSSTTTLIEHVSKFTIEDDVVIDVAVAPLQTNGDFDSSNISRCPPVAEMFFKPYRYYVLTNKKLYTFTQKHFKSCVAKTLANSLQELNNISVLSVTSNELYVNLIKKYGQHEALVMLVALSCVAARPLSSPVQPREFHLENNKKDAYSHSPAQLVSVLLRSRDTEQAMFDAIYDWIARTLSPIWNHSILDPKDFSNHLDIALIEQIELSLISFRCLMQIKLTFLSSDNSVFSSPDSLITRCVQVLFVLRRGLREPTLKVIEGSRKTTIERVRQASDYSSRLFKYDVNFAYLVCMAKNKIVRDFITAYISLNDSALLPEDRTPIIESHTGLTGSKGYDGDRKVIYLLRKHVDKYFLEADYAREEVKRLCSLGQYSEAFATLSSSVTAVGSDKNSIMFPIDDLVSSFSNAPVYVAKVCKLAILYTNCVVSDVFTIMKNLILAHTYCVRNGSSNKILKKQPNLSILKETEIELPKSPEAEKWNRELYEFVLLNDREYNQSYILTFDSQQNIEYLEKHDTRRLAEKYVDNGEKAYASFTFYKMSCEASTISEALENIKSSINFAHAASLAGQSFDMFPAEFHPRVIDRLRLISATYEIQAKLSNTSYDPKKEQSLTNRDLEGPALSLQDLKNFCVNRFHCEYLCLMYIENIMCCLTNNDKSISSDPSISDTWDSIIKSDKIENTFDAINKVTSLKLDQTYGVLNKVVPFEDIVSKLIAMDDFKFLSLYQYLDNSQNVRGITWLLCNIYQALSGPSKLMLYTSHYNEIVSICEKILPIHSKGSFPYRSELMRVLEALNMCDIDNTKIQEKITDLLNKLK